MLSSFRPSTAIAGISGINCSLFTAERFSAIPVFGSYRADLGLNRRRWQWAACRARRTTLRANPDRRILTYIGGSGVLSIDGQIRAPGCRGAGADPIRLRLLAAEIATARVAVGTAGGTGLAGVSRRFCAIRQRLHGHAADGAAFHHRLGNVGGHAHRWRQPDTAQRAELGGALLRGSIRRLSGRLSP